MIVKVIATLCAIASPDTCRDQIVTTSDYSDVSMKACQVGMPQLADFMRAFPQYDELRGWRCEHGDIPKKERI